MVSRLSEPFFVFALQASHHAALGRRTHQRPARRAGDSARGPYSVWYLPRSRTAGSIRRGKLGSVGPTGNWFKGTLLDSRQGRFLTQGLDLRSGWSKSLYESLMAQRIDDLTLLLFDRQCAAHQQRALAGPLSVVRPSCHLLESSWLDFVARRQRSPVILARGLAEIQSRAVDGKPV
jgi:hypothetical protein